MVADRTGAHREILLAGVVVASLLRGITWAYASFAVQLVLVILSELASSPVGLISDASIMAAGTGVRMQTCRHMLLMCLHIVAETDRKGTMGAAGCGPQLDGAGSAQSLVQWYSSMASKPACVRTR